jgi:rhodanese-related sulfurtransferase
MDAERVEVDEIKARIDGGEKVLFIDCRDEKAWANSRLKISGAIRITDDQIEGKISDLPRDRPIVAYCA